MVAENLTLIHQWQRNLTQNRAKSEIMMKIIITLPVSWVDAGDGS